MKLLSLKLGQQLKVIQRTNNNNFTEFSEKL